MLQESFAFRDVYRRALELQKPDLRLKVLEGIVADFGDDVVAQGFFCMIKYIIDRDEARHE